MILDRIENAKVYLGINEELDRALFTLSELNLDKPLPARTEISEESYFIYLKRNLLPRRYRFEYHRRYLDIHVPINMPEQIAFCASTDAPPETEFDTAKDCALFLGKETYQVTVPVGWFCICFPGDAHEPLIGDESMIIHKVVFKVPV